MTAPVWASTVWASWVLFIAVVLQRLLELPIARRNTRALMAAGGVETGAAHYPLLIGVHVLWLVALAIWIARFDAPLHLGWACVYLALQPLRVWVMLSLGRFWTTRIITVPGAPLVRSGPYRLLRHPNYAIVIAEVIVLPLAVGAWPVAAIFAVLNGAALAVRLRAEDAALQACRAGAAGQGSPEGTSRPTSAMRH
jgi:methyltransferase